MFVQFVQTYKIVLKCVIYDYSNKELYIGRYTYVGMLYIGS